MSVLLVKHSGETLGLCTVMRLPQENSKLYAMDDRLMNKFADDGRFDV
jgi:hypothetical protein